MKKLFSLLVFVLLFGILHCYTEWKFNNEKPKGIIKQVNEWTGKIGQTQITDDFNLIGKRLVSEDDYVGSYIADCDGETEKDVVFGGASIENRKLKVYGTLKAESGEATVRIQTNLDVIELTPNEDGSFEASLSLTSGGNYIMVDYEDFIGKIELYSEYEDAEGKECK